jgi:oligopeptide transport system permease protein
MTRFLLRRLLWLALTVWLVVSAAFLVMRATPGGPFSSERALSAEVERSMAARYHLDWPLWRQYLHYVGPFNLDERGLLGTREDLFGGALAGDFGPSFAHRDLWVNDILAQSLPISLVLGALALWIAVVLGLGLGVLSAVRPDGILDHLARICATLGTALPNFVIAGFLILVFAIHLPLFPVAGWGTLRHLVLPSTALALPFAANIARLTRAGMLEALERPHIQTAIAKGLRPAAIVLRHALREALLPVISYLGPAAAGVLSGSLVIEKIFFIPGTGSHFVNSALNRDYTLAMGVTVLYTVLVFVLNTLVDLAYGLLDPRVELEHRT